jgi:hypothetical protein
LFDCGLRKAVHGGGFRWTCWTGLDWTARMCWTGPGRTGGLAQRRRAQRRRAQRRRTSGEGRGGEGRTSVFPGLDWRLLDWTGPDWRTGAAANSKRAVAKGALQWQRARAVKGEGRIGEGAHQLFRTGLDRTGGLADWRTGGLAYLRTGAAAKRAVAKRAVAKGAVAKGALQWQRAEGASGEGRIGEGRTSVISWTGVDRTGGLAQRRGAQRRRAHCSGRGRERRRAHQRRAHISYFLDWTAWTRLADWRTGAAARRAAAKLAGE